MEQNKKDLREDLLNTVDSMFSEFDEPQYSHFIESIRGVFQSSSYYDFPELQKQIEDAIEFHYTDGKPNKEDIETKIKAVFLSWRYRNAED